MQFLDRPILKGVIWVASSLRGERIKMIDAGVIDPVLVTKSALKNAVSVVTTIISADCVISNMRHNESN